MASEVTVDRVFEAERSKSTWNPFRICGTDLPPNLVLMAKILALCFLLTGQWGNLPDHFLPFLQILEHAGSPAVFQHTLQTLFLIAAASLLFNYQVRTSCLVLGGITLIGILSSRPYFENNRTFTGCLWFVAGLYVPGQKGWLVRWQVILLYFGAGLNKLLDADWRSGQFFENMEANLGHHREFYERISSLLPAMWVAKLMSWTVIAVEFIIAGGFLIRSLWGPIAWLGIAYHTTLLVLTGYSFGMFYYATASSFLAFVDWPLSPMLLRGPTGNKLLPAIQRFDLDGLFHSTSSPREVATAAHYQNRIWTGLGAVISGREYEGFGALYMALVYNPLIYFAFAILLAAPFPHATLIRRVLSVVFLLFMFPALVAPAGRVLNFRLRAETR